MGSAPQSPEPAASPATPPIPVRNSLLNLPVFRPVALKMLQLLTDEEAELESIASLLRSDPGLSAQVLAMANSALYGNARRIDNLQRAILVLGLERTKSVSLTVALRSFLRRPGNAKTMERCWQHSMATALLAEELAPLYDNGQDEAYTAALVHDIGRLGLLMAHGERYVPLLEMPYENSAACLESERSVLGMDHCHAGLWLTQHWGFPPSYSRVAGCHHDSLPATRNDLASLTHIACMLADALGFQSALWSQPPCTAAVLEHLPSEPWNHCSFEEEKTKSRIARQIASLEAL